MLRVGKESKQNGSKILQDAATYFGEELGLTIAERNENSVHFTGPGGHVLVQVGSSDAGTEVDIQTQEFEYDVKQFLQKI